MAGPLGVTHLLLFSRSKSGHTNLRIALTPRGPTLHFQIEKYSLCKDVAKAQKHPRGGGKEFISPPLLVMNNFSTPQTSEKPSDPVMKQLESLTTTIFQSMFPPISPQNTPLSSIRRIMLLNREVGAKEGTYVLNLRHYAITTKATGVPKRIRRLDAADIPNLGKLEDMADYLAAKGEGGYTSASETELDTDAEVEVVESTTRKVLSRKEMQRRDLGGKAGSSGQKRNIEKRAVKLVELGPRMKLRMVKVEEGVCEGRIMWHEFVHKSKAEEKEMAGRWAKRRQVKEERKKLQKENVERKKELRRNTKANGRTEGREGGEEEDEDDDEDMDDAWDSEDIEEEDDDGVEDDKQ